MKVAIVTAIALSVLELSGHAQGRPQAGPEVKKLELFVGDSTTEGTMTLGTTTGTFTSSDHAVWMDGGFFVENHAKAVTPFGADSLVEIYGYDARRKVYTHDSFSSGGVHVSSTGVLNGDKWVFMEADGRSRDTITPLGPKAFSFKTEVTQDGKTWLTLAEGKTTKK